MGTVILVCNHKGGVGKTMLSVHLAAWAVAQNLRTVAIDTDPQGSMTHWASRSKLAGKAFPDVLLLRPHRLLAEWDALREKYEAIVIDTPPNMALVTEEIAPQADVVLVPVNPGGLELDALQTAVATLPLAKVRLVLNRDNAKRRAARVVRRELEGIGAPVSFVRETTDFADATIGGGTVLERLPKSLAAFDVRRLARESFPREALS